MCWVRLLHVFRVLFRIQTNDRWQNIVLGAAFMHASLIAFEAPNWRASHVDAWFDHWALVVCELACIAIYTSDVAMKMLYFGGWIDYVSKEWQRNYLRFIVLFTLDIILFKSGVSKLRFSRPFRLCVIAGRHRDVRRLISTIPKMCSRLLTTFAIPLSVSISFFAVIIHRFYASLPAEMHPNLEEDTFEHLSSCFRALFVLATLSNFEPVVTETFLLHPWSAIGFIFFMIVCSFGLMSVALGVVYDIYIEDHERTVTSEQKKEGKSLEKCFKKLDLNKNGLLEWKLFAEMMCHLRPYDCGVQHSYLIFREIAHVGDGKIIPKGVVGLDLDMFKHLTDWVSVSFRKIDKRHVNSLRQWAQFEYWYGNTNTACHASIAAFGALIDPAMQF